MRAVDLVLAPVEAVLGLGLAYDYGLLYAGYRRKNEPRREPGASPRLAIAIPAHNESAVIGASVARMRQLDYPAEKFAVHVVADYCDDDTAQVAHAAGAVVHERQEGPRGRKGYALAWLFERLLADPAHYDAIVVFDADSRPAADFLHVIAQALAGGAHVVQGRHVIANPEAGSFSGLADADMRLNNRIRNQAKENLGLSARLMGDAMCFRRAVLETYPWLSSQSLTEDRDYGIYLVTQGLRVRFAGDAISAGQAAARWQDATSQRLRWYGGVFGLQKRYLRPLLQSARRMQNPAAVDLALELTLPSFSALAGLALGLTLIRSLLALTGLASRRSAAGSALALALTVAYPFAGLAAERAPQPTWRALAYGPLYAAWRIWISVRVRLKGGNVPWVRTRRTEETPNG